MDKHSVVFWMMIACFVTDFKGMAMLCLLYLFLFEDDEETEEETNDG